MQGQKNIDKGTPVDKENLAFLRKRFINLNWSRGFLPSTVSSKNAVFTTPHLFGVAKVLWICSQHDLLPLGVIWHHWVHHLFGGWNSCQHDVAVLQGSQKKQSKQRIIGKSANHNQLPYKCVLLIPLGLPFNDPSNITPGSPFRWEFRL